MKTTKSISSTNYTNTVPMSLWAEDDLPSQKLLLKGTNSLSDSELLSIIIGAGMSDDEALVMSRRLLSLCGNNLSEFWKMSVADLVSAGISQKRALKIVSVFAIARRKNESEALRKDKISSSKDAAGIFFPIMSHLPHEEFWLLVLNKANRVIRKLKISEGGISGTVVDPKKVFKMVLELSASSIILAHNHPSGNIQPSDADHKLTRKLVDGGNLLDIAVLDHLIIAEESYFSFADDGRI